jgi:phenylacetic acid degradation protein
VGRNAMVGMNAVVMDGAVVGEESIVAAMSFVKAGMVIPPRSMVMGTPAKVMRALTDEDVKWKSFGTHQYHQLTTRSLNTMREVEAFTEIEPNRPAFDFSATGGHAPKK